jgi:hypothetical protein
MHEFDDLFMLTIIASCIHHDVVIYIASYNCISTGGGRNINIMRTCEGTNIGQL